ncbi:MAG: hypothetical protein KF912_12230 [Phycisphaeraceae bacterium]|nr:hypothetical protein [Phycisphaeraceae bacterium]
MKRLNLLAASLLLAPASLAIAQPDDTTVDLLRVYDTRDFLAYGSQGGTLTLVPHLVNGPDGGTIELKPRIVQTDLSDVVLEIAGVSGLAASRLQSGVYLVTGAQPAHEQFVLALDALRATNGDRYIVRLEAQSVVVDNVPSPGDPAPAMSGGPIFRSYQTINARAESVVQAMATDQYVSGWVPVVSESAVGYQVQYSRAENGFAGQVTVGAGEASDGSVMIQLTGVAVQSDISTMMIKLSGDELPLNMVHRQERSINSSIVAPIGQRVVLTSVSGFEPGSTIIISASVSPAPKR